MSDEIVLQHLIAEEARRMPGWAPIYKPHENLQAPLRRYQAFLSNA